MPSSKKSISVKFVKIESTAFKNTKTKCYYDKNKYSKIKNNISIIYL